MIFTTPKLLSFIILVISLICFLSIEATFAQSENIKIIPLSPNAAEMTRYGEVPVSHFTGIPNISIPIYNIKSGSLELPINLSYHAGGNKVESIASWVGLSWSISGLPVITRSVNAQPDEGGLGYFTKIGGKTIREYAENYYSGYDALLQSLLERVRDENADTEPDVFYFNINRKSGKFFFNQDVQQFVTNPYYPNLKIEFGGQTITITDDDGTKYLFGEQERTSTSSTTVGQDVTTGWMISKIVSINNRDTISFSYNWENQVTQSLSSEVKNIGVLSCSLQPEVGGGQLTSIVAKALSSINFKNGHINFNKNVNEREDLTGGYALDNIKMYNSNNDLIKHFEFKYKYLTGSSADNYKSNKWMLLTNVREIPKDNSSPLLHSFQYNEMVPPNRYSRAQDYWGYYNGELSNKTLVPTTTPEESLTVIAGANRRVNPLYTQFGILKKVTYPTGGYTLFTYENNDSFDSGLPKVYITESPYIAQEDPVLDGQSLPNYKEFEATFVINNPPDKHLNNGHPEGGAFISADIKNLGINQFPNGVPTGSSAAAISIVRISPSSPNIALNLSANFSGYYMPNGTYKLKAVFNQDPPNYQEFSVIVSYDRIDSTVVNQYLGGVRVKQITSHSTPNAIPVINNYIYKDTISAMRSSGISFLRPLFNYSYKIFVNGCQAQVFRIRSYSNQPQVSSSGSYVGYKKVFVTSDTPNFSGFTSYAYTHQQDYLANENWPFIPAQSMNAFRGQLEQQREYKIVDSLPVITRSSNMFYTNTLLDSLRLFAAKTSTEQILGSREEIAWPKSQSYEIALEWSVLSKRTDRVYNINDTTKYVETNTDFEYIEPDYRLVSKTTVDSKGRHLKVKNYYPDNITSIGIAEDARQWLLSHNNTSAVLKQETTINDLPTYVKTINYKNFDGQHLVMEHEDITYMRDTVNKQVVFKDLYDNYGNLLQHHQQDGTYTSYLWGYKGTHPVIAVQNATYQSLQNILGSSAIEGLNVSDPGKATIDAAANTLRNNLPYSLVTAYTYKPLVGMTSMTDGKGKTTYYDYDGCNRLRTIKDDGKNIVKQFSYSYTGKEPVVTYINLAKTSTFQKNDCGIGYVGSSVTYTVPGGAYTSTTSPQEADQKAQADINANGQNYANQHGTCMTIYARVEVSNYTNYYIEIDPERNIREAYADVHVRFYSDAACQLPLTINYPLNVYAIVAKDTYSPFTGSSTTTQNVTYQVPANSNSYHIGWVRMGYSYTYPDTITSEFLMDTEGISFMVIANGTAYTALPSTY